MLQRFQRIPIHQKLVLIALLTTGGALLLAGAALIYFNVARFKEEMKRDLETLAQIVGQHSTAALTFGDKDRQPSTCRRSSPGRRSSPPLSMTPTGICSPVG